MKKLFLTLGAILVFGIVSAQTDTAKTTSKSRTQTDRAKKQARQTDTRTPKQQRRDADRNLNSLEKNNNSVIPTPPASAPGSVNTNSSAMPQVTPQVTTPPPGAPMTPPPAGTPIKPVPTPSPKP